jgi:hypothetical protein
MTLPCAIIALLANVGYASTTAGGPVERAWRARADLASRKLAQPGMDACDRAVEEAFRQPRTDTTDGHRTYLLSIGNGREQMLVAYFYEQDVFKTFSIGALPPGWVVLQNAGKKTVTVRPGGLKCVFDLCASDPLVEGACREDRGH